MADTGWVICGTGTDLGNVGSVNWVNVSNITADDAAYAYEICYANKDADTLKASNFGLSIPAGATIDGVEVRLECKEASGEVSIDHVVIGEDDSTLGTWKNPGTAITTSWANYDYGGASDTWGLSLTEADVEASTFQVRVIFYCATAGIHVDQIAVKVHYTESGSEQSRGYVIG